MAAKWLVLLAAAAAVAATYDEKGSVHMDVSCRQPDLITEDFAIVQRLMASRAAQKMSEPELYCCCSTINHKPNNNVARAVEDQD